MSTGGGTLGGYLAALRSLHGNDYAGQVRENGVTIFGAYGMLLENWGEWAARAGFKGADNRDPDMQDAVAAHWANGFFRRYGNWDLVSAAWYSGQDQADAMLREGRTLFRMDSMRRWQEAMNKAMEQNLDAALPNSVAGAYPPDAWLHPVAGVSKYSNSFMPNTLNHRGRTHPAIDVYAEAGTPVVAPTSGTVIGKGTGETGGHWVRIQDSQGLVYYFAHMAEPSRVNQGQVVGAGEHIGYVGNSGSARTTSPHLHFSIKKGSAYVNPYSFLQGSQNANGFYSGVGASAPTLEPQQMTTTLDTMLNTVSNQTAGGQRLDPRTLAMEADAEVPLEPERQVPV